MKVRVEVDRLRAWMHAALRQQGLSEPHSQYVVDGLINTSLRGVDTHGIVLFPLYLRELDGGRAAIEPVFQWRGGDRAVRSLDAGGALGLVAGCTAAEKTVALAKRFGIGCVAVANSNHFGAASVYTLAMAEAGTLAFAFSNSDALVAPHGGSRPIFGTNPLSVAVQGSGDECFCLDMATSQVAYSKIKRYRAEGKPLESGWAVAKDGTDMAQSESEFAAMKPLGGYKGQGLGMVVEILCTLLTGMPLDHQLSHLYGAPYDAPRQTSHVLMALDIAAFVQRDDFAVRLSTLLGFVRSQEATGVDPVINPGDKERACREERLAEGIPIPDDILDEYRQINATLSRDQLDELFI